MNSELQKLEAQVKQHEQSLGEAKACWQQRLHSAYFVNEFSLYRPLRWDPKEAAEDSAFREVFAQLRRGQVMFDAYCVDCRRESHFKAAAVNLGAKPDAALDHYHAFTFACSRHSWHEIKVWLRVFSGWLEKIGQTPSVFALAAPKLETVSEALGQQSGKEFKSAAIAHSHGMHVAGFCYLRRVFEQLLVAAERAAREEDSAFVAPRFVEQRVAVVAKHLPDFMAANATIYTVLSKGVHELSEEECAAYFDVMRETIQQCAEDVLRKRADEEKRQRLRDAVTLANSKLGRNAPE